MMKSLNLLFLILLLSLSILLVSSAFSYLIMEDYLSVLLCLRIKNILSGILSIFYYLRLVYPLIASLIISQNVNDDINWFLQLNY
jgi:hypothetical protein